MTDRQAPAARPGIPPAAQPAALFLRAIPELSRIEAALAETLRPAMTQDPCGERGFAEVAWMLAKGLRFLLQAAGAAAGGDRGALDEALAEVDADTLAAAAYARLLRAAAATPQDLAAAGEAARMNAAGLGECIAAAVIIATATDTDRGLETDEFRAELGADGGISLASRQHGQLPVDGRAQLDLTATLDALGTVCGRAVAAAGMAS